MANHYTPRWPRPLTIEWVETRYSFEERVTTHTWRVDGRLITTTAWNGDSRVTVSPDVHMHPRRKRQIIKDTLAAMHLALRLTE